VNLQRFPFHFLFRIVGDVVRILVVRHHRRRPTVGGVANNVAKGSSSDPTGCGICKTCPYIYYTCQLPEVSVDTCTVSYF
jgi:hypothetical protein